MVDHDGLRATTSAQVQARNADRGTTATRTGAGDLHNDVLRERLHALHKGLAGIEAGAAGEVAIVELARIEHHRRFLVTVGLDV